MADEAVKKSLALRLDDPTRKAMEEMTRAANPLAETLRAIENSSIGQFQRNMREPHERSSINQMMEMARLKENSGITRMMESINLHKDLALTGAILGAGAGFGLTHFCLRLPLRGSSSGPDRFCRSATDTVPRYAVHRQCALAVFCTVCLSAERSASSRPHSSRPVGKCRAIGGHEARKRPNVEDSSRRLTLSAAALETAQNCTKLQVRCPGWPPPFPLLVRDLCAI
jgi:hypothetical protein